MKVTFVTPFGLMVFSILSSMPKVDSLWGNERCIWEPYNRKEGSPVGNDRHLIPTLGISIEKDNGHSGDIKDEDNKATGKRGNGHGSKNASQNPKKVKLDDDINNILRKIKKIREN